MNIIKSAIAEGTTIKVQFDDGTKLVFEDCWLRDNCRCSECYNEDLKERLIHILDIPESYITNVENKHTRITVTWNDKHVSTYDAGFLFQFDYKKWNEGRTLKPVLWKSNEVETKIARVDQDKFLNSKEGAKLIFQSLLDYGIAVVDNVKPTMEATEVICNALGGVMHTYYGGMWKVSTEGKHADTAYTNLTLKQHTDNTYFCEPAGLQIFHCTEHINGTGGESIFMDGFYGVQKLREEHPEDFEFLSKFQLDAEYLEDSCNFRFTAPVIELDSFGKIKHLRFNSYDRVPMAFSSGEECKNYYRAIRNISKYFEDPKNQFKIKLVPGIVIAFDNFRILHGRSSFTGKRVLCGSYVKRDDWLCKTRLLKLTK